MTQCLSTLHRIGLEASESLFVFQTVALMTECKICALVLPRDSLIHKRKDFSAQVNIYKKIWKVVTFCLQIREVIDEAVLLQRAAESLITNSL